ncbi:hypothetical protein [Planotetraspora kaengkrachanensis]|uniref:Uncharacterized protein n=1 Tax=Planotetraspora kaengkrachanensis TaxID=575193 RepID=A0A8J3PY25_9ACTN|nr:hypothetical protein [Planotetraspora kaengkrachanensis]GIG83001.1 hypothetical protein Pka01_61280 [Planotetraspora kaengkrachanensis]
MFDLSVLDTAGAVSFTGHCNLTLSAAPNGTLLRLGLRITETSAEAAPTIGKLAMFLAVRYRPGFAARKTKEPKPVNLDTRWARFAQWNREVSRRRLDSMSDRRWGVPVTLLSASVGIPPLYGVALIGGASRMGWLNFSLSVLAEAQLGACRDDLDSDCGITSTARNESSMDPQVALVVPPVHVV